MLVLKRSEVYLLLAYTMNLTDHRRYQHVLNPLSVLLVVVNKKAGYKTEAQSVGS